MTTENNRLGKVYLVGAGPGDPGLLTIKGKELLARTECLIYDRLASPRLLAFVPRDAEKIYVGKRIGKHAFKQEEINALIVRKAKEGRTVVRLKGGDPFIFGRGGEEAEVLAEAGIPFEIVPGVTSAIAVPAYAGIPLTHRAYTASVAFITGHRRLDTKEAPVDWEGLAKGVGTLVFLMGMTNLPNIAQRLIRFGRSPDTPVAVIRWGTTPNHQSLVGKLSNIATKVKEAGFKPPAIIVVGEVTALKDRIGWYEKLPLLNRRILVTRTRAQASELVRCLEERGADCLECPTIEVRAASDQAVLEKALKELAAYDWIIFSSVNGVSFFFEKLFSSGKDIRALGGIGIATVGQATSDALHRFHIVPDIVPEDFRAEGLLDAFSRQDIRGKRILIPRARKARELLPQGLQELGAEVTVAPVYETTAPVPSMEICERLEKEPVDLITFTSSSTVKNFFDIMPPGLRDNLLARAKIACIGPVTAKTAREMGIKVHVLPQRSTIPDLVDAIEVYLSRG